MIRPRLILHSILTALLGVEVMVLILRLVSRKVKIKNYPINLDF